MAAGSILGNAVLRTEDRALLTDGGMYVDDQRLDGAVHVVYVRSTMAHARLTGVDVGGARGATGVVAVFTAADILMKRCPAWLMSRNRGISSWLGREHALSVQT